LFALVLALSAGFPACKKKETIKKGTKIVKIDWKKKWDKITADGEQGKFFIKRGLGTVSGATTAEAKDKGYLMMVKGFKIISDAISRGDDLLDTVKHKEPGRNFPEWEKTLASWTEERQKVNKNLPMEYIDKLHEKGK
jgi:hypothetical protein